MSKDAVFGYEWRDGELVVNEKEQAIVKWINKKLVEYSDNPPKYLIKEIMDHSEKKLSTQEACKKISLSQIEIYLLAELNVRMRKFKKQHEDFLEIQLDEELQADVEKEYRLEKIIEKSGGCIPEYRKQQYIGNAVLSISPSSNQSIISREMYEKAAERIQEFGEGGQEEQSTMQQEL